MSEHVGDFRERQYKLCRGQDDRPVTVVPRRKSLSVEHTYPSDLPDLDSCRNQLPALLRDMHRRLRRLAADNMVVTACVKLKLDDFTLTTLERTGSDLDRETYQALCAQAYARYRRPVRLLGVGVRFVDLREDQAFHQLDLFAQTRVERLAEPVAVSP